MFTIVLYELNNTNNFTSVDFGSGGFFAAAGSITTGSNPEPITVTITDDDASYNNTDSTAAVIDTAVDQNGDPVPGLVGGNLEQGQGLSEELSATTAGQPMATFIKVSISGTDYVMVFGAGVQPNTTYNETNKGSFVTQTPWSGNATIPCFATGTKILTNDGYVPVEELTVGESIVVLDGPPRPIKWISATPIEVANNSIREEERPIMIPAGALALGTPDRDLIVSQQHRVLANSKIVQRMTGEKEVLVAAKKLLGFNNIKLLQPESNFAYHHILLERHSIVVSNGALTESFYLGPHAIKGLCEKDSDKISAVFPSLHTADFYYPPARKILEGPRSRRFVDRHIKNNQPLQIDCAWKPREISTITRDDPTLMSFSEEFDLCQID